MCLLLLFLCRSYLEMWILTYVFVVILFAGQLVFPSIWKNSYWQPINVVPCDAATDAKWYCTWQSTTASPSTLSTTNATPLSSKFYLICCSTCATPTWYLIWYNHSLWVGVLVCLLFVLLLLVLPLFIKVRTLPYISIKIFII